MEVAGIHERDGYVEIVVRGMFDVGQLSLLRDALLRAASRPAGTRALLNLSSVEAQEISTLDRYKMGMTAAEVPPSLKLAFVAPAEFLDPRRFGEKVARNRGARVRAFDAVPEALAWLLGPEEVAS